MNHAQYLEEQDAFFARADRFDGFDRGDLDNPEANEDGSPIIRARLQPGAIDDGSNDIEF